MSYSDNCNTLLLKSRLLEEAYKESLQIIDISVKDEGARRLRLRVLMLENENDDLHQQLALAEYENDVLRDASKEVRERLEQSQAIASHSEQENGYQKCLVTKLRVLHINGAKERVVNICQAEVASLKGVTTDSVKLLTEKLAIARELSVLQTELEYLRSQASYQQTLLSEKLALQRQVKSLEVELEAEKRASERAAQKNHGNKRELDLRYQIKELQNAIVRMKEESENTSKDSEFELGKCKEAESKLKESESRQSALERKLEQTQTRLQATREQLKALQTELKLSCTTYPKAEASQYAPVNSRKRAAHEINTDVTIGTPDGVAARGKRQIMKRGKVDQTMVGEKSMFSITPFLNRTSNINIEDPVDGAENELDCDRGDKKKSAPEVDRQRSGHLAAVTLPATSLAAHCIMDCTERLIPKKDILGESKKSVKQTEIKRTKSVGILEEFPEDKDQRNGPGQFEVALQTLQELPSAMDSCKLKPAIKMTKTDDNHAGPKKKKHKFLAAGRTIFDEDEKETVRRPLKVTLGPPHVIGKRRIADSNEGARNDGNTMSAFSPLKKDRRGVGASFLL